MGLEGSTLGVAREESQYPVTASVCMTMALQGGVEKLSRPKTPSTAPIGSWGILGHFPLSKRRKQYISNTYTLRCAVMGALHGWVMWGG